ncbi:uncharacterized protein Z520_04847 [Fonsecaea multimorphosa CBS 102226]|uniref:Chromosome transmission fidelity protein 4 n=1 Tax=Fonsecaea multimorphosa CBS 102226 TaxID=1442371 RepID=A0A0D2IQL8_9EURO|nr:uncharacterized protein Z520_04847 [Fonsecaea multimorphosa CBS 102226]KIX99271.1 hypothetical protein Z520_04847 [Fonsecaea multimorphosa CBS 102226]OAL25961.1 hypothetical protein AYO22_04588 [Fonsecaea multimorphosa]
MTSGPMRKLPIAATTKCAAPAAASRWTSLSRYPNQVQLLRRHRSSTASASASGGSGSLRQGQVLSKRHLAQVRPEPISEVWFTSASPRFGPEDDLLGGSPAPGANNSSDHKPPDERLIRLGKTLRTLSPLLPDILTKPLPPEILSPNISLHLFPSTHPHLPAVKGRVAYRASLWTAPVAWGCVPIVGNVKLRIISEKIVRTGFSYATPPPSSEDEQEQDLSAEKLVVRWKTEPKTNGNGNGNHEADITDSSNINRGLSKLLGGDKPIFNLNKGDDFTGLFIFTFDSKGRIASHTIEHAEESNGYDKTSKVVTLTDWLLGKAKWGGRNKEQELVPGLAMRVCRDEWNIRRGVPPNS